MKKITEVIRSALGAFRPPPELLPSEWADRERYLSAESSAAPGKWDTSRAPYAREPMNCVKEEDVHEMVLMWSAQVGKTEILNNLIGYHSHHDPCPMLIVQPTLGMASAYSKDRLSPMIRDTPALREIFGEEKSRSSGNTVLHKKFPSGQLTLSGANSPASLASRPVRLVGLDEIDRFPASAGSEGDPVSLAVKRTTTFFNWFAAMVSTPTIEGASRIKQAWDKSDQRRYYLHCPGCGDQFALRFSDAGTTSEFWKDIKYRTLKWDAGKPETAHVVCEACGMVIDHSMKFEMLSNGVWIKGRPEVKGIAGFHLNELYSPWKSWEAIVRDFLNAKGNPETLKTFINTSLGETWQIQGDAPEWKRLYDRREEYSSNTIPAGVKFLTCAVDVQKNRIELEIRGWGANCESWSIDYRVFHGDTSTDEAYEPLDKVLNERWKDAEDQDIGVLRLAIDSGYRTHSVYKWARKYPRSKVMVIKGVDELDRIFEMPKQTTDWSRFPVWKVGVSTTKRELYGWLRQEIPSDEEILKDGYPYGFIHFPKDYPEEYFKMLTAEVEDVKNIRGFPTYIWIKRYDRNEALDLAVYNRAAAASLGIERSESSTEKLANRSRVESKKDSQKRTKPRVIRIKSSVLD